jgi:predicted negative regulator of RcsB-dependent stress response
MVVNRIFEGTRETVGFSEVKGEQKSGRTFGKRNDFSMIFASFGLRFYWLDGRFHPLTNMDSEATQSTDFYKLVAWLHKNQKQVTIAVVAAVLVGGGIYGYTAYSRQKQVSAGEALSNLRPARTAPGTQPTPVSPDAYLKVANEHPGTSGGAQALLLAAGGLFDAGKFKDAQTQFQRFLNDYPDNPLVTQARIGVAASLEAQGDVAQATAKYQDIVSRQPNDSVAPQAKSALARLYVAQGKYAEALKLYEELAKTSNNDSWSAEAPIQAEELMAKHPELRPPATPAPAATAPTLTPTIQKPLPVSTNPAAPTATSTNKH